MAAKLTILIPCLNSEKRISPTLRCLVEPMVSGLIKQVLFADGGSDDATQMIAEDVGADFIRTPKGRGVQFKVGVIYARAEWLLFIHDDSLLDDGWADEVGAFINDADNQKKAAFFKFALNETGIKPNIVKWGVNLRCKLFKLPYGDQGLLISRALYEEIGGFSSLPLMEDVEMVERIKAHIGRKNLVMLDNVMTTSADKFTGGYLKRVLRNFKYLISYKLGVDPKKIVKTYYKS